MEIITFMIYFKNPTLVYMYSLLHATFLEKLRSK